MPSPLELLRRVILSGTESLPQLKSALAHITEQQARAVKPNELNRQIVANEMRDYLKYPDVQTHLFLDKDGKARGAYQVTQNGEIPYLLSDQQGLGSQLLEDAYQHSPFRPVSVYSLPESMGFYRKQPGWLEDPTEPRFIRKRSGGLVQLKECSCGKT